MIFFTIIAARIISRDRVISPAARTLCETALKISSAQNATHEKTTEKNANVYIQAA